MAIPITWNATDIADGVRDIRGKWINNAYLRNANPDWSPISAVFKEDGASWQTENCQMKIVAPKIATRPIRFINSVAWDVHDNTSIGSTEQELLILHPDASPVDGVILEGRENQVVYPNAIMEGVDIVAGVWHGRGPRAEHIYVIRKMPPGIGDLNISCNVTGVRSKISGWNGVGKLDVGKFSVIDRQDDRRGIGIRQAVAWYYNSNGEIVVTPISVSVIILSPGVVRVTKTVPRQLIADALAARADGELRCDLTGTFYPDANPETTTCDGNLLALTTDTWANIVATTNALNALDDQTDGTAELMTGGSGNNWARIRRCYCGFSLSSLSGATVSGATLSVYYLSGQQLDQIGSQKINISTSANIASNTSLATTDFDEVGQSQTAISTEIAISSLTGNAYNAFAFDSTGVSDVQSKTGSVYHAAVRVASDISRVEPTWSASKSSYARMAFAETAGTSSDPKLVVTYTVGSTSVTPRGFGRGIYRGTFRGVK
jgi:hypothetical protein